MDSKDQSLKQILESEQHNIRLQILKRDVNSLLDRPGREIEGHWVGVALESFASPSRLYPIDQTVYRTVFKKTDAEKALLFKMKSELPKSKHHHFVTILKGDF